MTFPLTLDIMKNVTFRVVGKRFFYSGILNANMCKELIAFPAFLILVRNGPAEPINPKSDVVPSEGHACVILLGGGLQAAPNAIQTHVATSGTAWTLRHI